MLKKKVFHDTFKDSKTDFIQDHHGRYREHCDGVLQLEREMGSTLSTAWTSGNF